MNNNKLKNANKKNKSILKNNNFTLTINKNEQNKIGIFDPNGLYPNPFTQMPYENLYKNASNKPGSYTDFSKKWREFPVYKKRKEFVEAIKNNQVILVDSGTGSGKTVLVPKFALHALNYNKKIAVTIPKQIIVQSSAEFAAKCLDVKLGKEVGYKFRGSPSSARSKDTNLLFTTDGTIVAQLINDISLPQYDMVIIDEAHERNPNIDFMLLLLKKTLLVRPDFKLIIMSATIDIDLFKNYFPEKIYKFIHLSAGSANPYPIEDIFLKKDLTIPVLDGCVDKAIEILQSTDKGDILVFVKSSSEARKGCQMLGKKLDGKLVTPYCVELYSGVSKEKEKMATSPTLYQEIVNNYDRNYKRKVVFSTNVAESSLTVEGVIYVIDNGLELVDSYDPERMMKVLSTSVISNAQRMQRRGRAGRTAPGYCYYMYTKKFSEKMPQYPTPAIRRTDLSGFILRLFTLDSVNNIKDIYNLLSELIEIPKKEFIESGLSLLLGLGILETSPNVKNKNLDGSLTKMGNKIVKFAGGMSPANAVAMYYGYENYVKTEVGLIVTMLEIAGGKLNEFYFSFSENKFSKDSIKEQEKKYNLNKKKFLHQYGDFMSLYKILLTYEEKRKRMSNSQLMEWCTENNINFKNIKRTWANYYKFAREFMKVMHGEKKLIQEDDDDDDNKNVSSEENNKKIGGAKRRDSKAQIEKKIIASLFKGYVVNVGKYYSKGSYYNCFPKLITKAGIDRDSFINLLSSGPKHLYYGELQEIDGQVKMNLVNKIPTDVLDHVSKMQQDILDKCPQKLKQLKPKETRTQKNNRKSISKKRKR